jgi:hypothetical protein
MRGPTWKPVVWLVAASLVLAGCGGGGGGGPGGVAAKYLTADAKGMLGAPPASEGLSAPSQDSASAAGEIAREIEEADVYAVSGDVLFLLNPWRGLVTVDLSGPTHLGRVALGVWPQGIYLRDGRALVVGSDAEGGGQAIDVDVSDPASPSVTTRLSFPGWPRASRLVGDVLYVVTESEVRSFLVAEGLAAADAATLPDGAAFVHATDGRFFVAGWGDGASTRVTIVDASDPEGDVVVRGGLSLPGWVSDDEKLHFGAGTFRAVTHDWADGGLSRLFTVDVSDPDAPYVRGSLDLAKGEQTFATRFTDDAAYVTTFFVVDPLWVVDLSDPDAPTVAGSLEVPGWSTHLVPAGPGRLVGLGIDPGEGWTLSVSLFDVADPAHPALLDREDLGWGWSEATGEIRAFGVFPEAGLVLVPFSGESDRLEVIGLGASALARRGFVPACGGVLRGFPHARGIVVVSGEEVVVADPETLGVVGRATVAEEVVDVARLPDGTVLPLVRACGGARLGDVALDLYPSRLFPYGFQVAVTGWDASGRAAYVVDFSGDAPRVSSRFDLGGEAYALREDANFVAGAALWQGYGPCDAVLTGGGRLVVHGSSSYGGPWVWAGDSNGGGKGGDPGVLLATVEPTDGFVVIDVPGSALLDPVAVTDGLVTGFTADGEDLVWTQGTWGGEDSEGRPLARHDLVRVDLVTRATTEPVNVPGYVVSASGGLAFTVEDSWGDGWSWLTSVVAVDTTAPGAPVVDRLPVPMGSFDFRAAGSTLFFTDGGAYWTMDAEPSGNVKGEGGDFAWTAPDLRVVRLGATLSFGPSIPAGTSWLGLLLPEDGSALVMRDGAIVERWDVAGSEAVLDWSLDAGAWPLSARADLVPGDYLVAAGYAGWFTAP